MPFLTEELWQRLETGGKSISLARYPAFEEGSEGPSVDMSTLQGLITEIRQARAANKVDRSQVLSAEITSSSPTYELIEAHAQILERLGNVTLKLSVGAPLNLKLNIPVDRARLEKENEGLEKQIANLDRQFANNS